MVTEVGGDEGGDGGMAEVSRDSVKIRSPILTFEFVLDTFLMMFEVTPSSILDSKI